MTDSIDQLIGILLIENISKNHIKTLSSILYKVLTIQNKTYLSLLSRPFAHFIWLEFSCSVSASLMFKVVGCNFKHQLKILFNKFANKLKSINELLTEFLCRNVKLKMNV